MSLRVLVIPDKFKGTLTAAAAARAIARGWRAARPQDRLTLLPMSDGGDGFGEVISALLGARAQRIRTVDAAHRSLSTTWWWEVASRTAIIESANVIGLAMLPKGRFHPFHLDTYGLGKLLLVARRKRARRILVGVGGSATNDGGFGLARALGWRFVDSYGEEIKVWTGLDRLASIKRPRRELSVQLTVALDVQNRLLGAHGATRIYGPQKGLRHSEFHHAETCLKRLAAAVRQEIGCDHSRRNGAGAAGGLGFGLMAFCNGRGHSGFEMFASSARMARHLSRADLVITGEGTMDASTVMGKGVGEIARRARRHGVPCVGLAGVVIRSRSQRRYFAALHGLTDYFSRSAAVERAAARLAELSRRLASAIPDQTGVDIAKFKL